MMLRKLLFHSNRRLLILTTALLFAVMISCIKTDCFPCLEPRGAMVTESRSLASSIQAVDLRLNGEVFIERGQTPGLTIIAAENLLEHITTRISGEEIVIEQEGCIKARSSDIQVMITLPQLHTLKVSGSGNISLEDAFETDVMRLAVSGSGTIRGPLSGHEMVGGISGSGIIEIVGRFLHQKIAISGSGEMRNQKLLCQQAEIFISGSGNAYVHAEQKMKVVISGSGNTWFYGSPLISSTISGSGKVIRASQSPIKNY